MVTLWNLNFKAPKDEVLNGALNDALNQDEEQVIELLRSQPTITQIAAAEKLGFSRRKYQRLTKSLTEQGIIERIGSKKTGRWIVYEKSSVD